MKNKKTTIGAYLLSFLILTGCGGYKEDTKESSLDNTSITDILRVEDEYKIFEPGTHYLQYFNYYDNTVRVTETGEFVNTNIPVLDGYEFINVMPVLFSSGATKGYMYFFVNTKTVKVKGVYDYNNNVYNYSNPGEVVEKSLVLEK